MFIALCSGAVFLYYGLLELRVPSIAASDLSVAAMILIFAICVATIPHHHTND